jgi:hypothetical protein
LSLVVYFLSFNSHFPVTALRLDLISRAYFNKFAVCIVPSDRTAQSQESIMLGAALSEGRHTEPASEKVCSFKNLDNGQSPKRKIV